MRLCLLVTAAVTAVAADSRRVVQPSGGGGGKNSWKPHKPLHIASELKSPQQQRGSRNTNFANQNSYGGPPEASEPIDLHNKECKSGQEPQQFTETKLTAKKFIEQGCTQGKKTIPHTKLLPECRNVTKQNCVTLWETDADGKQVWAGTDACEPVTWQECKLVPKDVKFIVPEIKCEPKQELWYHEPEEVTDTRMTNTFNCKVKSTSHCTTQTRPDCKQISWNECKEVPVKNCNPKSVHIPTQELLHRKKCLLPDTEPDNGYGAPADDPLPSYGAAPAAPVYTPAPQPTYHSG